MSDSQPGEVIADDPQAVDDHGDAPGREHADQAHVEEPLGPIDWPAYGAGALGLVIGLAMAAAFAIAVGAI